MTANRIEKLQAPAFAMSIPVTPPLKLSLTTAKNAALKSCPRC